MSQDPPPSVEDHLANIYSCLADIADTLQKMLDFIKENQK